MPSMTLVTAQAPCSCLNHTPVYCYSPFCPVWLSIGFLSLSCPWQLSTLPLSIFLLFRSRHRSSLILSPSCPLRYLPFSRFPCPRSRLSLLHILLKHLLSWVPTHSCGGVEPHYHQRCLYLAQKPSYRGGDTV